MLGRGERLRVLLFPLLPVRFIEVTNDLVAKRRQVFFNYLPDIFFVYLIIIVYQNMTHLYDVFPWSFGMSGLKEKRKFVSGLAYNLNVLDYTIVNQSIFRKGIRGLTSRISQYSVNTFKNM